MSGPDPDRNPVGADSETELSDSRRDSIDELGHRAGAALRRPAPLHGAAIVARRARVRRTTRAGGAAFGVVAVLVAGIALAADRDGPRSEAPVATVPDRSERVATTEPTVPPSASTTTSTIARPTTTMV